MLGQGAIFIPVINSDVRCYLISQVPQPLLWWYTIQLGNLTATSLALTYLTSCKTDQRSTSAKYALLRFKTLLEYAWGEVAARKHLCIDCLLEHCD